MILRNLKLRRNKENSISENFILFSSIFKILFFFHLFPFLSLSLPLFMSHYFLKLKNYICLFYFPSLPPPPPPSEKPLDKQNNRGVGGALGNISSPPQFFQDVNVCVCVYLSVKIEMGKIILNFPPPLLSYLKDNLKIFI